jgi:hypothetical protein
LMTVAVIEGRVGKEGVPNPCRYHPRNPMRVPIHEKLQNGFVRRDGSNTPTLPFITL